MARLLILIPPSETKRPDGGTGALDLGVLGFPELAGRRRAVLAAAKRLPLADAAAALHLGPQSRHEARWNRALRSAPVLPAIERYSGVLYDGIGVESLDAGARAWIDDHVVVASAMFGLLRASDPIPPYRLSASSRLPGLALKAHWSAATPAALERTGKWLLDARSAAYAALGPVPAASVLHVESEGPDGTRRALNHFNKHGKGELVRALARSGANPSTRAELLDLALGAEFGLRLEPRGERDVVLVL